jgi:mxaA protein
VPANAIVEQPRSFGYVIGDVVTQRVLLRLGGKEFVPAELPTTGRAGVWLERRTVRIETDAQGRRWLAIDYQLMNSPQSLAVATLPAWKLASKDAQSELRVAEWPMTVGADPERPFARAGLGNLRPDRSAALIVLAPMQRRFAASIALLIATIGAWLAWWAWRNWRASSAQPFAAALREMRHVDDTTAEVWHALHRAFDATAGRAVRAETLPALFDRAPQLQPMRTAIEQFFNQSAARFFAGEEPRSPVSVHALCRDLRRIEKRHES